MKTYFLYHLTHIKNLESILEYGLLSRNSAISEFIFFENIADPEVLNRGQHLFDYVRLYFNPKNPMLYRRKDIQDEILILCIDGKVLLEKDSKFSDGNASSASTKIYSELEDLKKLDWKVINAKFWTEHLDGKRKACAEALIHSKIPVIFIKKIICNNINTQNNVIEIINNKIKIVVEANKGYYF